jgi:glycine cleavage system H lipoate-binding protein
VALLRRGDQLEIGYGDSDQVTIEDFFNSDQWGRQNHNPVDTIQLADGSLLTAADIDAVVQQMSAYAVKEGISLNSLDSVKHDENLMALVAGSWHAA